MFDAFPEYIFHDLGVGLVALALVAVPIALSYLLGLVVVVVQWVRAPFELPPPRNPRPPGCVGPPASPAPPPSR